MEKEKRLIDAYRLEDLLQSNSAKYHHKDDVIAAIAGQPTVDAVEVVRCKDCKHCIYISYACGDVRCGKLHTDYIKEYSFCSYGERKDNE